MGTAGIEESELNLHEIDHLSKTLNFAAAEAMERIRNHGLDEISSFPDRLGANFSIVSLRLSSSLLSFLLFGFLGRECSTGRSHGSMLTPKRRAHNYK